MKAIDSLAKDITQITEEKKPLIWMVLGLVGFGATVIEAMYAKPKADKAIAKRHENRKEPESKAKEIAKDIAVAAPIYLPTIVTGTATVLCLTSSYKESNKRTAAYATAYGIAETKLKDYQSKVVEKLGEKKEREIRDEVAASKVKATPAGDDFVINDNETLCFDSMTGRYFRSNIETIRQAVARLNQRLYSEMYISLNEFFAEIGIPEIKIGDELGWNVDDGIIEIFFSSCLDDKNRPCLVIDYDISPRFDFRSLH